MTERRILPQRTNRGKRPQTSQEQKARDDIIYNQIFQQVALEQKQLPKKPVQINNMQARVDSYNIELQRRQMYGQNRVYFPYPRGYHYYFLLEQFPRDQKSVSYAIDQSNIFKNTYSQQNKIVNGDLTVGALFNRKLFGLPIHQVSHLGIRSKDKNICHGYLFQNQDRKFQIDRSIYELKQILKNFDKLNERKQLNNFSCLKRDIDLFAILQDQITVNDKKNILKKKIKILSEKKQSMKQFVMLQDKYFFYHSLNQRLHDQIEEKSNQLSMNFILGEIQYSNTLRSNLSKGQQKQKKNYLKRMFLYNQSQNLCIKQQTLQKILNKIGPQFFEKQKDNQSIYAISMPFIYFNFSNQKLMNVTEKVMALRLINGSEASFYISKIFWKRIFNRDLIINKQLKPYSRIDFDKNMMTVLSQLQKWKKQQESKPKNTEQTVYPQLDNLINWNVFSPQSKSFDLLPVENSSQRYLHNVQISARQYICIMLFYHLYLSISQIYEFILNNETLSQLIASSQFFAKSHNYLTQAIGTYRCGLIQQILKRLNEQLLRQDFSTDFRLKWVYNEQLGVSYIVKLNLESEWETQKQQQQQEDNLKQIMEESPKKRVLR